MSSQQVEAFQPIACAVPGGPDCMLLSPPGGGEVRVRFEGVLQGHRLTWDGHFMTLQHAWEMCQPAQAGPLQQFIEVGEDGPLGRHIQVGLAVPVMDRPSIIKTVIMLRQYKRLRPGRHDYGPAQGFAGTAQAVK